MREFDTIRQTVGGPAASAVFDAPWTPLYLIVVFRHSPGARLADHRRRRSSWSRWPWLTRSQTSGKSGKAHAGHRRLPTPPIRPPSPKARPSARWACAARWCQRQIMQRAEGLEAANQVQILGVRYNTLVKFIRMFMQSLALGVGAWLAVTGQISVGSIIAASVLLSRALQPVEQLVGAWPTIMQARNALDTLRRLFDSTEATDAERTALPKPKGDLELDRIIVKSPGRGEPDPAQRFLRAQAGRDAGRDRAVGFGQVDAGAHRRGRNCARRGRSADRRRQHQRTGIRNCLPCMSATCRRTWRCCRARSARTSRASAARREGQGRDGSPGHRRRPDGRRA